MFENKYPYTDFHDLNLDWFLAEFKKVYNHVDELDATVKQFTDFVTNYFDNLNVQEEVNKKLDQMASDGTLSALIQPLFDEYKLQIDAEIDDQNDIIADQNTEIATIKTRMDSFTHLAEGSTTGDAELIDGRIGSCGNTYDNIGDAIREQTAYNTDITNDLYNLFDYLENITPTATTSNRMYNYVTSSMSTISNCNVKTITVSSDYDAYFVTTKLNAGTPQYAAVTYFDEDAALLDVEYVGTNIAITNRKLNIPANCAYFYVNARNFTSVIKGLPANVETVKNIKTKANDAYNKSVILTEEVDVLNDALRPGHFIYPDSVTTNAMYKPTSQSYVTVPGCKSKKYIINSDVKEYFVTSALSAGETGFTIINYFAADDTFISYEGPMTVVGVQQNISCNGYRLTIPAGASYFVICSRSFNSSVKAYTGNETKAYKNTLSVLFVGNSMTQDAISYLPYLLSNYYPGVNFKIYNWYNAGLDLNGQYQKFTDDLPCQTFSVAENTPDWTQYSNSKKMSDICTSYKFDLVVLQEYFNYKDSYTSTDLNDWNNVKDYITSHYTGGNPLEFIGLMHAPLRTKAADVMNLQYSAYETILKQTICQDVIPCGVAIYDALSTSIGNLGDGGDLTTGDRTHTQEGLPSLIQDYTLIVWLLDRFGMLESVYGCPLRMDTDIYDSINVPGPNIGSGVVTGTDADNLVAQEVAIKAAKKGKKFVMNNLS